MYKASEFYTAVFENFLSELKEWELEIFLYPQPFDVQNKLAMLAASVAYDEARAQLQAQAVDYSQVVSRVIELANRHANTWTDKSLDFWYRGLAEEMYELSLAIDGQHEDPPEYELLQISAIAINFIRHLKRCEAAAIRATGKDEDD